MKSGTVQDAGREPALRGYELRRLRIPIGGGVVSVVVPDATTWRRGGAGVAGVVRGGEPPYWTKVWLAAVAVSRMLARMGDLSGNRVCDLGCGLGLPGIVAAGLGASVTFVDQEAGALAFAGWNGAQHARGPLPSARRLDWACEDLQGRFDVMVLADVTYRACHHAPLLRQIERCLPAGGIVLHADPLREESDAFLVALRDRCEVGVSHRRTSFGEQSGDVRVCVAAADRDTLARGFARCGLQGSWEVFSS